MPPDETDETTDPLLAALPQLLRDLSAGNVVELEVTAGEARLYVRQRPGLPPAAALLVSPPADAAAPDDEEEAGLVPVVAPLSGMFYASSSPNESPYVQPGDPVEEGQVVGLVEAMKVFNEIHAEVAGTVARIVATPGHLVQAKQPLMLIRPGS